MKFRMQTRSGSVYKFDTEAETWERLNTNLGHEEIIGHNKNSGKWDSTYDLPLIGLGFSFATEGTTIWTTLVERLELLED
jgi:hypothetical protein